MYLFGLGNPLKYPLLTRLGQQGSHTCCSPWASFTFLRLCLHGIIKFSVSPNVLHAHKNIRSVFYSSPTRQLDVYHVPNTSAPCCLTLVRYRPLIGPNLQNAPPRPFAIALVNIHSLSRSLKDLYHTRVRPHSSALHQPVLILPS